MRIAIIMIVSLLITNCTNSYVKNKKTINSPNDLMKFTNVWCEKINQKIILLKCVGKDGLKILIYLNKKL